MKSPSQSLLGALDQLFNRNEGNLHFVEDIRGVADVPVVLAELGMGMDVIFPAITARRELRDNGNFLAHRNVEEGKCLALAGDKYAVFFGRDELLLKALESGPTAGLGSTYNFAAPLYFELERRHRRFTHQQPCG